MKHIHRVCQQHAGEPRKSDKNEAAFATTSKKFALIEEFSEERVAG